MVSLVYLLGLISGLAVCAWRPYFAVWIRERATDIAGRVPTVRAVGANNPISDRSQSASKSERLYSGGEFVRTFLAGIVRVLAGLWRYKFLILVVAFFCFGFGVLRGCVRLDLVGKSRGEIALERELAQAELEMQAMVAARDAVIAQAAQEAAVHRAQISVLLDQGRSEIDAATPHDETHIDPDLERAWLGALGRLYSHAGLDASRADPVGSGSTL